MMLLAVPGFSGDQTSLNPVGPGASAIEHTFALIFWITAIVYCIVLAVFVISIWRRHYSLDRLPDPEPTSQESDARAQRIVVGAIIVTTVLLFTMMISSFATSRAIATMNY